MDAYETSIYTAVLITALFLLGLILFFVITVVRQHRRTTALQRQHFLHEITVLEKERSRIARDLHDELAPRLSLTKFGLEALPSLPPNEQETSARKLSSTLSEAMQRLGEIAVNLNAGRLVQKGFCFALEDFLEEVRTASGIQVSFQCLENPNLLPETDIHLYRIVQEVVQNTLKHAGASQLTIRGWEKSGWFHLSVKDDGKGFIPGSVGNAKGLGLQSIRSRMGMLGGRYQLETAPGKGTHYLFELPLKKHQP